jgi:hypothetical protein
MNTLQSQLAQFTGTQRYYGFKPLTHLVLTDGAKYFNDISPVVQDMAIVITHTPHLKAEEFLVISINVHEDRTIATIDDGNDNVLYEQSYDSDQGLESGVYKLYATNGVLLLTSEY